MNVDFTRDELTAIYYGLLFEEDRLHKCIVAGGNTNHETLINEQVSVENALIKVKKLREKLISA
jgi:hypothetical protein